MITARQAGRGWRTLTELLFTTLPLWLVAYLHVSQPLPLRYESHAMHEVVIAISILEGLFVSYITWRCYQHSGEQMLRWLALGFLGFTLIYTPHGLLTGAAHQNIWLFLMFGPMSRIVMLSLAVVSLTRLNQPADTQPAGGPRFWLTWLGAFLAIIVLTFWLAAAGGSWRPSVRLFMESGALITALVSIVLLLKHGRRRPLLKIYAISIALFAQASLSFLLASPWSHQWWLAHGIFAAGFTFLSYGVVQALLTTGSFEHTYSQEQMMRDLAAAKARAESAVAELEAHRRALERTVSERTAELSAALEQAQAANAAKSEFLSMMSHELRTPIQAIVGYADLARAHPGASDSRLQRYFQVIKSSSSHLMAMLADLLDLSRIEASKLVCRREAIDLVNLACKARDEMAPLASANNIELCLEPVEVLPCVTGDPERLGQVLRNLIDNAIKFSTAGHTVRLKLVEDSGSGQAGIEVHDTGVGIAEGECERIFERFVQGSQIPQYAAAKNGLGLGLAISKGIVDQHGGRIFARANIGGGAVFTMLLPARQAPPAAAPCATMHGLAMPGRA